MKTVTLDLADRLGALSVAQRLGRDVSNAVYVLAHHRVDWPGNRPWLAPEIINSTPAQFEAQMCLIAQHYRPVAAEDVLEALAGGKPLPRDAVLVTVDDGYRDFKETIFPIASRYGIRPVLFLPTLYVGRGSFWWDDLYVALQQTHLLEVTTPLGLLSLATPQAWDDAYRRLALYVKRAPSFVDAYAEVTQLTDTLAPNLAHPERVTLDWDELRALARAGATIAAHTHTHPALGHIPRDAMRYEVSESLRLITQEIGPPLPLFAFPYGIPAVLSQEVLAVMAETEIRIAFTMIPGRTRLKSDNPLYLPRLPQSTRLTPAKMHLQLTPLYDYWVRTRSRFKAP